MPSIVHCLHMQKGKVVLSTGECICHSLSLGLQTGTVVTWAPQPVREVKASALQTINMVAGS